MTRRKAALGGGGKPGQESTREKQSVRRWECGGEQENQVFTEVTTEGEMQEEKGVSSVSTSAQSRRRAERDHGPHTVAPAHFFWSWWARPHRAYPEVWLGKEV